MAKYTVELTGHTKHFVVTEEDGHGFLVTQFYDENSEGSDWEVTEDASGKCVTGDKRQEIIDAITKERS